MTDDSPFTSRKFWISIAAVLISCGLPVLYKQLGISESVTLAVLGLVSAISLGYSGANLIDKKISSGQ